MKTKDTKNLIKEFGNKVKFDYELKKKNWFNIGGKTKIYYKAENLKELVQVVQLQGLTVQKIF